MFFFVTVDGSIPQNLCNMFIERLYPTLVLILEVIFVKRILDVKSYAAALDFSLLITLCVSLTDCLTESSMSLCRVQ